MKVVFYSVSVSPYGAPTSLLNLLQGLCVDTQHDIVVIVPKHGPLTERLKSLKVRTLVIPHYKWTYSEKYYQYLQQKSKLLAWAWFQKNLWQKLLLNLFLFPVHLWKVWRIAPDLIYVNASACPVGILVAKVTGIISIWHHREPVNDASTDFYIEWHSAISEVVVNLSTVKVYNSEFLKQIFRKSISRPFTGRTYVVHNGVPSPAQIGNKRGDLIVFGMVGKIESGVRKGQAEVVQIFADMDPEVSVLHVYGDGKASYVSSLEALSSKGNVVLCGFKRPEQIYPEIDFLIMNSMNESFGRVVAEAYSYGVPVLARRSGALPEIVDEGVTGFLYDHSEQLRQLIAAAIPLRGGPRYEELTKACKQRYLDSFTIEKYTQRMIKIMEAESSEGCN